MTKRRVLVTLLLILFVIAGLGYIYRDALIRQFFRPTETTLEQGVNGTDIENREDVAVVAENLDIPWEIAFLPDGDLLVTERTGELKRIGEQQQSITIGGVEHVGEGGLLGMALHPDFENNRWIYLYLTTRVEDGLINRIERYVYKEDRLSDREILLSDIPGAQIHDGGRMSFGPDGYLYITTGDAAVPDLAQDRSSLAGKTLRITDQGDVPEGNPFGTAVYSYGHRNAQGMAWDSEDRFWQTEHGPTARDELNRINSGANYGWPVITGDESQEGMRTPAANSGADETWAPAGMAYYDGSLFFAGLRGESLYEAKIQDDTNVDIIAHFREEFGRLRAVTLGPDNFLYISTSNTDGRGDPQENDDRIIRINPTIFR